MHIYFSTDKAYAYLFSTDKAYVRIIDRRLVRRIIIKNCLAIKNVVIVLT